MATAEIASYDRVAAQCPSIKENIDPKQLPLHIKTSPRSLAAPPRRRRSLQVLSKQAMGDENRPSTVSTVSHRAARDRKRANAEKEASVSCETDKASSRSSPLAEVAVHDLYEKAHMEPIPSPKRGRDVIYEDPPSPSPQVGSPPKTPKTHPPRSASPTPRSMPWSAKTSPSRLLPMHVLSLASPKYSSSTPSKKPLRIVI
ncbi:hypothetical protein BZG36_01890 [Bifiguratus adelaidae]|uniref:Uncharacterized protein n=1 Tax=Bifiguratus adelaidae TaxID=1938954 RepID=A0A261Y4D7_9FUNG|nr:hypothetical protein BZG36_01890 [Bifiguratus adelaidae]